MIYISNLYDILFDTISDYAVHAEEQEPKDWLQDYLGRKLPEKSVDRLHEISSEITSTLELAESKKAALKSAIEVGDSAESWFAKETMKDSGGNFDKARMAAEFLNGITSAEQTYDETKEAEFIDVENENWTDDEWNDYRLKDSLKGVAISAGKAGLREIASDAFLKASEDGIAATLSDGDFVKNSLGKGAVTGIKYAVSAGLAVAEESGVIPPSAFTILATTAHKTVENLVVFSEVINGRKTMTEALIDLKNTAVSTFSTMWAKHGAGVIHEVKEAVISVFGIKGAVISGVVTGLLTPPQEESKFVHVLKETGKAVVSFLTKEIHIPGFEKLKKKLFNW